MLRAAAGPLQSQLPRYPGTYERPLHGPALKMALYRNPPDCRLRHEAKPAACATFSSAVAPGTPGMAICSATKAPGRLMPWRDKMVSGLIFSVSPAPRGKSARGAVEQTILLPLGCGLETGQPCALGAARRRHRRSSGRARSGQPGGPVVGIGCISLLDTFKRIR